MVGERIAEFAKCRECLVKMDALRQTVARLKTLRAEQPLLLQLGVFEQVKKAVRLHVGEAERENRVDDRFAERVGKQGRGHHLGREAIRELVGKLNPLRRSHLDLWPEEG